jgi:hypothetical protein
MPCVFAPRCASTTHVVGCSDETVPDSFGGGFSSGSDIQLGEDVGDVGLGGAGAYEEGASDLAVGVAPGNQAENLEFA